MFSNIFSNSRFNLPKDGAPVLMMPHTMRCVEEMPNNGLQGCLAETMVQERNGFEYDRPIEQVVGATQTPSSPNSLFRCVRHNQTPTFWRVCGRKE
jgi:hypothetical protein